MRISTWSLLAVLALLPGCPSTNEAVIETGHGRDAPVVARITRPTIVEIRRGPQQTLVAVSLKMTDTSGVMVFSAPLGPVLPTDMHVLPANNDGSGMDDCALCQEFGSMLPSPRRASWTGTECNAGPSQPCPCPPK